MKQTLQKGDRVVTSGHGKTKTWGKAMGIVTKRRGNKVFVQWRELHFTLKMRWISMRLDQTTELKLINNDGFTLGERLTLLDGNTLLCRHCGSRLFWSGELIDFRPLGFNHINRKIACVRCGQENYYDVKELEKHEVNFVGLWAEP